MRSSQLARSPLRVDLSRLRIDLTPSRIDLRPLIADLSSFRGCPDFLAVGLNRFAGWAAFLEGWLEPFEGWLERLGDWYATLETWFEDVEGPFEFLPGWFERFEVCFRGIGELLRFPWRLLGALWMWIWAQVISQRSSNHLLKGFKSGANQPAIGSGQSEGGSSQPSKRVNSIRKEPLEGWLEFFEGWLGHLEGWLELFENCFERISGLPWPPWGLPSAFCEFLQDWVELLRRDLSVRRIHIRRLMFDLRQLKVHWPPSNLICALWVFAWLPLKFVLSRLKFVLCSLKLDVSSSQPSTRLKSSRKGFKSGDKIKQQNMQVNPNGGQVNRQRGSSHPDFHINAADNATFAQNFRWTSDEHWRTRLQSSKNTVSKFQSLKSTSQNIWIQFELLLRQFLRAHSQPKFSTTCIERISSPPPTHAYQRARTTSPPTIVFR